VNSRIGVGPRNKKAEVRSLKAEEKSKIRRQTQEVGRRASRARESGGRISFELEAKKQGVRDPVSGKTKGPDRHADKARAPASRDL